MPNGPKEHEAVRFISLFYLAMAGVGLGLIWWRRDSFDQAPLAPPGADWPLALAVTASMVLAVHLLSRLGHDTLPSLRHGARDIQRLLGNLGPFQMLAVALTSGIGEEILFRGWLMNETGLWISSVIFGVVHVPPTRQWPYWPFFAFVIGAALGWLYLWSGSLVFPVLLHAGINFFNLRMLLKKKG